MTKMQTTAEDFYLPAEWEPQSGVQLTWPHTDTDWKPYLEAITATEVLLAKTIARYERVLIVAQEPEEVARYFSHDERQRITFRACPLNDTWARDHAFITLRSPADGNRIKLLDFRFNGWGNKFRSDLDTQINRRLFDLATFNGEYVDCNDMVLEGGSIESDGKGTLLTTSLCLLAPHRNQPMSRNEIEAELMRRLHVRRVLWVDHGRLDGDDTDGHIDTTVRFAPNDTLLYVGCDDPTEGQYHDFKQMEEQLKTFRTLDGRPYRLLRLPFAPPMTDNGERLPATYANFVIVNGAVIYPTYGHPQLDRRAAHVIGQAFPGRAVVGIDASTVVRQHGSLHCLTMQFPERAIVTEKESSQSNP